MSINSTMSSVMFCSCPTEEADASFSNMDPTIVMRLHSILSGIDVFHLNENYDYQVQQNEQNIISMSIPNDLADSLKKLGEFESKKAISDWYDSQEVRLSNWSMPQTKSYFQFLTKACRNSSADIKINMSLVGQV